MRERRNFSNDFKKQIVKSIVSGLVAQAELARQYKISPVMINCWKKDYKAGKFFENVSSYDMVRHELRIRELEGLIGRLTLENEILKKTINLDTREKRRFIHSNLKGLVPIKRWCKIVGIKLSTYYYKPKRPKPSDMDLAEKIEKIALDFPSYGYRRITAALHRDKIKVNHKRVLRLMKCKKPIGQEQEKPLNPP